MTADASAASSAALPTLLLSSLCYAAAAAMSAEPAASKPLQLILQAVKSPSTRLHALANASAASSAALPTLLL
jgi:alpha-beta hydrolase superfamily lysophospholipase